MTGKNVIVAVTGSIAAYKAATLIRLLVKAGNEVQVLMTNAGTSFISQLTLSTLSKRPVYTNVIDEQQWNNHVELGLWADAMVIAPCTANTLAKCAHGQADSMVVATYLSARCPVFIAPAMDLDMWAHPATQRNVDLLKARADHLIPVGHGELASGLTGDGRMAEPEEIVTYLETWFTRDRDLQGRKVLITAGPTHERIDPVRFLGNRSTGKMGIAIAEEFSARGADVQLILGPTHIVPEGEVNEIVRVASAQEMFEAAMSHFNEAGIVILAAAVADYRPVETHSNKMKKQDGPLSMSLERTRDIAMEMGKLKRPNQIIVGFALETDQAEENALSKVQKKNFDFIVLNNLNDEGAAFAHDTNKVKFIYPNTESVSFALKSKRAVAGDIADAVVQLIKEEVQQSLN